MGTTRWKSFFVVVFCSVYVGREATEYKENVHPLFFSRHVKHNATLDPDSFFPELHWDYTYIADSAYDIVQLEHIMSTALFFKLDISQLPLQS